VIAAHIEELIGLTAQVIRSGIKEGTFRSCDHMTTAKAVLFATSRFHHRVHAAEWGEPAIDQTFNDVWRLLMEGLATVKNSEPPRRKALRSQTRSRSKVHR